MIDSLRSEEPGTFFHVRDVRVDRQVDRLELMNVGWLNFTVCRTHSFSDNFYRCSAKVVLNRARVAN